MSSLLCTLLATKKRHKKQKPDRQQTPRHQTKLHVEQTVSMRRKVQQSNVSAILTKRGLTGCPSSAKTAFCKETRLTFSSARNSLPVHSLILTRSCQSQEHNALLECECVWNFKSFTLNRTFARTDAGCAWEFVFRRKRILFIFLSTSAL